MKHEKGSIRDATGPHTSYTVHKHTSQRAQDGAGRRLPSLTRPAQGVHRGGRANRRLNCHLSLTGLEDLGEGDDEAAGRQLVRTNHLHLRRPLQSQKVLGTGLTQCKDSFSFY